MALIDRAKVKVELGLDPYDNVDDDKIDDLIEHLEGIFTLLMGRNLTEAIATEFYNIDRETDNYIVLRQYPVNESPVPVFNNDDDWVYGAETEVVVTDRRVDFVRGIVYFKKGLTVGFQSMKAIYTAGFTSLTVPKDIEGVIIRQCAQWYQDQKNSAWATITSSQPGGIDIVKKELVDNLLPDFVKVAEMYSR